jgi:hypothetical protein
VRRSSSAAVIFASPNTLDHSAKSRFNAAKIVMQTPLPESLRNVSMTLLHLSL